MYKYLFSLLFLGCLSCQMQSSDSSLRLWYKQPAKEWMEATPTGNGRLGAMIYGGTKSPCGPGRQTKIRKYPVVKKN